MSTSHPPTRQAVLIAQAEAMRYRLGMSHEKFAERIDNSYCQHVAPDHRSLPAPDLAAVTGAEDYRKLLRAWDQTIRRYVEGSLRFPVELEEPWVMALEEPWRGDCIRELAQRYGLWGARRPEATPAGDAQAYGAVMRDFGELAQDVGQMLADGHFGPEDHPHLEPFMDDLERVAVDLESLRHQVRRAVAGEDVPAVRSVS